MRFPERHGLVHQAEMPQRKSTIAGKINVILDHKRIRYSIYLLLLLGLPANLKSVVSDPKVTIFLYFEAKIMNLPDRFYSFMIKLLNKLYTWRFGKIRQTWYVALREKKSHLG